MALPFDGKTPYRLPSFATGYETPAQRNKRLRTYQRQLETQQKRQDDRDSRELFRTISRNAPNIKLSPRGVPEPDPPEHEPRLVDIPDMPPAKPGVRYSLQTLGPPIGPKRYQWVEGPAQAVPGTQERYNNLLDSALTDYRATFGFTPTPDSKTYKDIERKALTDWRNEQAHIPKDAVTNRELIGDFALLPRSQFLFESQSVLEDTARKALEATDEDIPGVVFRSRSREIKQEALTDSKYQLIRDSITLDIAQKFRDDGIPLEGKLYKPTDAEAKKLSEEVVREYLNTLTGEIRSNSPDPTKITQQEVQEQVYLTLRTQEHLTEILDEWEWPEAGRDSPPPGAFDEAIRRTVEETGSLFGEDEAEKPGFLANVLGVVSKAYNLKFIPTLDPTQGFKPTLDSFATATRGGARLSRPVSRGILGVTADVISTPGLLGTPRPTEQEQAASALRSQLAEDILTDVLNPAYIAIALPTAGAGTAGLSGTAKATRIAANLLGTGLEPALARGTLRGLTLVAKSPSLITQVPRIIRESRLFQEGVANLARTRAAEEGGGALFRDENAIRQVVNDLTAGVSSDTAHLPLRVAVEEDMFKNGRSIQDIVDNGVTIPERSALFQKAREAEIKAQDLTSERFGFGTSLDDAAKADKEIGELVEQATTLREQMGSPFFRPGEVGGGELPFGRAAPETNDGVIAKAVGRVEAGDKPGISLKKLREITQNLVREHSPAGLVDDISDLRLSTGEIMEILKVYRAGGTDFMQLIADARLARQGPVQAAALPELIGATDDMTAAANLAFRTERVIPAGKHFGAFRNLPDFAERAAMKDEYIRLAREAAEGADNSVLRAALEDDIKRVEDFWDVYSGNITQPKFKAIVVEQLSRLTKKPRGEVSDQLRKLPIEEAQRLDREASEIVKASGLKGSKAKSAQDRLLMGALDRLAGHERFDAGRRLNILLDSTSDQLTRNRAYAGLSTLTEKGKLPTTEQLDALEQVLGADGLKALLSARPFGEKATVHLMDTLGIPRALMTSMDISALLRQGGILGAAHPLIWLENAGASLRVFLSKKYALEVAEELRYGRGTVPYGDETWDLYDLATDKAQLDMTRYGDNVSIGEYEEAFASSFIGRIPGVKQSARSYTLFLNKLRADVHDSVVRGWAKEAARVGGRQFSGEDLKDLGLFLNNATGRGRIPEGWENVSALFNVAFFSPRLQLSRFQLIGDVARAVPRAGRGIGSRSANQILRDMGLFFAEGFTIMGLLAAAADAGAPISVGLIPFDINADGSISSNPDFGKVRIGNTRHDFWGGFSQYARYFSEIAARSATGDWEGASKRLLDLSRSKTSPLAGGAWDAVTGHDFNGNHIRYNIEDIESAFENVFLSRTIPLIIQDVIQAGIVSNWDAFETITAGVSGGTGGGVASYRDLREERTTLRNEVSQEITGLDYDDKNVNSADRKKINLDPEIVALDEEMRQAGIERGDAFSVYEEDLEKFDALLQSRGVIINAQGEEEKVVNWTQTQLDDMLKLGTIDGPQWAENRRENEQKMWAARLTFVAENSPFTEDRQKPTNEFNKAVDEYFNISPAQFALPNGDMDWDGYEEARDKERKKALDADIHGTAANYFDAYEETETEKSYRQAREVKYGKFGARTSGLDNLPIYDGGVTQAQVDGMLTQAKDVLAQHGNPMGLSRYLQWLYYNGGPDWQTNTVSISYWVSRGLREYVINDEYENKLMNNPDVVRFFPSEFDNLNPDNQQAFLDINGLNYVSKARQEEILSGATVLTPPGQTPDERLQAAYGGQ